MTRRIVVAGDWHGNTRWARSVISALPGLLPGEDRPLILQLGDFGIWRGTAGRLYLEAVSAALGRAGAELWFVEGNHEDFTWLRELAAVGTEAGNWAMSVADRVSWLPRGTRWRWQGRTWLACGGGVSLDRAIRTEGSDWWPQEEITADQEAAVIAGGPADVLVSHDCPAGVAHSFPPPPRWWDPRDLARSDAHQERLQRITDAVRPAHVIHGHLHRCYSRACDFGYGPVRVTGLDADGQDGNYAVLDTGPMTWATQPVA